MTRLLSAFVVGACLVAGCTTTRTIRRPETVEELQSLVWKKREHITLLYGDPEGAASSVPASLALAPQPAEGDAGAPPVDLSNLRGYEVKRRGMGALEGLGLGTLFGFIGGAVIGLAMGSDGPCEPNDTHFGCVRFGAGEKALLIGGMGAIGGHALGPLIGAGVGHTDRYVFSNDRERP
jgi:hypothetical protein